MTRKATRNQGRRKPLHTISISPEAWGRIEEIAQRTGKTCSGVIEEFGRTAPMPRERTMP